MLNEDGDDYDDRVKYYTNEYGAFGHWGNTSDWRTAYRIWTIAFSDADATHGFFSAQAANIVGNVEHFQQQQLKNLTDVVYRAFALYFNSRNYMNSRAEKAQLRRVLGRAPKADIKEIVKANYDGATGAGHVPMTELNKMVNLWREIFMQLSQELGAAYGIGDRAMIEGLVKLIDGWVSDMVITDAGLSNWMTSNQGLAFMGLGFSADTTSLPRSLDVSKDTLWLIGKVNPADTMHLKAQIIGAMIQGMI
jgi:hypothetical protein